MKDSDSVSSPLLSFPDGFDDYEWELEAKGWFSDATLAYSGRRYRLNFYDPTRLRQTIEGELRRGSVFFEPNVVVIESVTRRNMEAAAVRLVQSGSVSSLIAESHDPDNKS